MRDQPRLCTMTIKGQTLYMCDPDELRQIRVEP